MTPKEFVARRNAVAADHVNLGSGVANRQREIGQQIKKPRIEGAFIAGAMVAQKVFKLGGCLRDVSVPNTIEDIDPLLVCV